MGSIPTTAIAIRAVNAGISDLFMDRPDPAIEVSAVILLFMAFNTFWML